MNKIILTTLALFLVSSCAGKIASKDNFFAPKPFRMKKPPANAHPDYLAGWEDGCETGMSTMSPGYYKSFYGFAQDPYKVDNLRYYKAWKDSYTYCRHYTFKYAWDSIDQTSNAGGPLCILCPQE